MIIKASQRSNGRQLARHLLNAEENEHITIHEVSGFISENLKEALQEAQALAKGTHCNQYLFSVSLNPPDNEQVDISVFEETIAQIEKRMKLEGQPRAIIFHEKEGRRHAHVVWSRIDGQEMKAINLPFYHNRLMEIGKALFLKHGWKIPQGHIDRALRNPLNFTRAEWQQAKRIGEDPRLIKAGLQQCWKNTDSRQAFIKGLEKMGYYLAKGDRRGYVLVDWRGEVLSLSRYLGIKTKDLKARLGEPKDLPSVQQTKANIDQALVTRMQKIILETKQQHRIELNPLRTRIKAIQQRHQSQRQKQNAKQNQRQQAENTQRQARFQTGFKRLWSHVTGKHRAIKKQNEREAYQCFQRDRSERETLILSQLAERAPLQDQLKTLRVKHEQEIAQYKTLVFSGEKPNNVIPLKPKFEKQAAKAPNHDPKPVDNLKMEM